MMLSLQTKKRSFRRWFMLALALGCVVVFWHSRRAASRETPFDLACDVPRGALVYAQFEDLPALLRQWDESQLKRDYLASANYNQFTHRHLALKLLKRWQEFNDALGFTLDTGVITGAADHRTALAIYDIGRLDVVFIAPLSDEKAALTAFFQGKDHFDETALPDGTTYYSREVAADNGRQAQKILFAMLKGRFVLATNEQLLLRALANINAKGRNDSLADEPAFRDLARPVTPHTATVWVDQAKLNKDWYFRKYWAMSDIAQLQNLRAGIFDWEMLPDKWRERREFLLTDKATPRLSLPLPVAQRLARFVPADMPLVHLQTLNGAPSAAPLVRDALFDRLAPVAVAASAKPYYCSSYELEEDAEGGYYSYLGEKYDTDITADDDEDRTAQQDAAFRQAQEQAALAQLTAALQPTQSFAAATAETMQMLDAPLFAESRRLAVLSLHAPDKLAASALEEALSGLARNRLMLAGASSSLSWTDRTADGVSWRVLVLPNLGWELGYARRDGELLFANHPDLLHAAGPGNDGTAWAGSAVNCDEYTVVRLDQRPQVLDPVAAQLEPAAATSGDDLLTTVSDLLQVAGQVRQVTRSHAAVPGREQEIIELSWEQK